MKYFELICTAYLKNNIVLKSSFNTLAKYISYSMAQVDTLKNLHAKEGFKHYNFGNFYPIEKEQVYQKGNSITAPPVLLLNLYRLLYLNNGLESFSKELNLQRLF